MNGKVTVNLGGPGSVTTARYTCDSGFELVGKETRVCEQDGVWQGSAPICKGEYVINISSVRSYVIRRPA